MSSALKKLSTSETEAVLETGSTGVLAGSERASTLSFLLDLVSLTKPGIMVLLLISTCCPMVVAGGGSVAFSLMFYALLGGALVSGSASGLNCVFDRDIDAIMERTKNRPLPAGRVSVTTAVILTFVLGVVGLVVLAHFLNPLAAVIALGGHLFYVFVYTLWLKRTTPQNIVIGGAAGAVPPLVGWAGVTGDINVTAILLFLVIFLWTPPHFWALALNKNTDYRRAGIPMLPVVSGEAITHNQMLFYALTLIPVCILLVITDPNLGIFSLLALSTLSVVFSIKVFQLKLLGGAASQLRVKKAWDVFSFSLIYLALFFATLVVDVTVV